MEVLANAKVVIMLQYINVPNQHTIHLNLHNVVCQLCLNFKKEGTSLGQESMRLWEWGRDALTKHS